MEILSSHLCFSDLSERKILKRKKVLYLHLGCCYHHYHPNLLSQQIVIAKWNKIRNHKYKFFVIHMSFCIIYIHVVIDLPLLFFRPYLNTLVLFYWTSPTLSNRILEMYCFMVFCISHFISYILSFFSIIIL